MDSDTPEAAPPGEPRRRGGSPRDGRSRARELSRNRERSYPAAETGRHHHLGAAPDQQPVHDADGVSATATAAVQMAARTTHHLRTQRSYLTNRMEQAARALDFEDAATCRDAIAAIDAELTRRGEAR